MQGHIVTIKNKVYIKTPFQTLVLSPKFGSMHDYKQVIEYMQMHETINLSDLIHECNNKVDIVHLNYSPIDTLMLY